MVQQQIDQLLAWASPQVDDIVEAKATYFSKTGGEVHEEDRCYEQRMQAFFNWYLFDRIQPEAELTPIDRYLREKGAELQGEEKTVLIGCTQSKLSLYEYRGTGGLFSRPKAGRVRVRDAFTSEDSDVTERRQMHGLDVGDLFEARLVPLDGAYQFSSSFTYHPREVKGTILREIKKRKKAGEAIDPRGFCWELEKMALQGERFRNVTIHAIYNFETPFLSKGKAK